MQVPIYRAKDLIKRAFEIKDRDKTDFLSALKSAEKEL